MGTNFCDKAIITIFVFVSRCAAGKGLVCGLNEIGWQGLRLVCFHKWSDWSIYPGWGGKMVRECTKCGKREHKVAKAGR